MAVEGKVAEYSYSQVARIPAFRKLWLGDLASQTADRMAFVAITLLAYGASASSLDVSLMVAAYFLPAVVVSVPGGVIADRRARRTVMVVAEGARVGIAVLMALAGSGLLLIGLVLAFSSLTYLFYPSRQASIPCLVPDGALLPANAAISANLILGFAVGPAACGLVAGIYSAQLALMVSAVVMACGVALIASIQETSVCTPAREKGEAGWSSLYEGMAEIRRRPRLWQGFLLVAFVMLAVGVGAVGLVAFADEHLGMGKVGFSVLLAALAVGTLTGAILIGRASPEHPKGRLLVVAALLAGAMFLALSRVDDEGLAMAIMVAIGVAASMVLVPFTTMLQEGLGDTVMGTGFGMLSMGLTTPIIVGVVIAGPFIEERGVLELFVFTGLLLLVIGLVSAIGSNLWSRGTD